MNRDTDGPIRSLDTFASARYLGIKPKTLANMRCPSSKMDGPEVRYVGRKPVYDIAALDAWIEAQPKRTRNPERAVNAAVEAVV